jgi:hypothetical protein
MVDAQAEVEMEVEVEVEVEVEMEVEVEVVVVLVMITMRLADVSGNKPSAMGVILACHSPLIYPRPFRSAFFWVLSISAAALIWMIFPAIRALSNPPPPLFPAQNPLTI